jgi:septal ring factor EnvC (AmiA/AmiB activator)
MNSELIVSKLQDLELKLKKLLVEHEQLKVELSASVSDNEDLRNIIKEQNEGIKNFQNQEKITKIVTSIAEGTQSNTELKLKINEYIKEIDRCIVYLSE